MTTSYPDEASRIPAQNSRRLWDPDPETTRDSHTFGTHISFMSEFNLVAPAFVSPILSLTQKALWFTQICVSQITIPNTPNYFLIGSFLGFPWVDSGLKISSPFSVVAFLPCSFISVF